tara:strand:- start:618 stop:2096 length:1479 start_codon:yes stop_codon:yes gene_type:complete
MEAGAIDHSLAEVAKSFHWREFGNGSANGNANYADASTLSTTADNIAYVMDDGLTSLSALDFKDHAYGLIRNSANKNLYITFIGTGITMDGYNGGATLIRTMAQNLPYGTHICQIASGANDSAGTMLIDGVTIKTFSGSGTDNNFDYGVFSEITFHQPKMPPIPDDACILMDVMLMADFVPQTSAGLDKVSKGTRKVAVSRDVFFTGEAMSMVQSWETDSGWIFYLNSNGTNASTKLRIPSFGTNFVKRGFHDRSTLFIGDSSQSSNQTASTGSAAHGDTHRLTANQVLGLHNFGSNPNDGANGITGSFEIVSPTHSSSHYKSFSTPFLDELVGGDRNMEQTNLVVTPDGKTWDEVTRDTSYLGNIVLRAKQASSNTTKDTINIFTEWRGTTSFNGCIEPRFNKDFAIAYDRMICLRDGYYRISGWTFVNDGISGNSSLAIKVNGTAASHSYVLDEYTHVSMVVTPFLKRGDYVQWYGIMLHEYSNFEITRV